MVEDSKNSRGSTGVSTSEVMLLFHSICYGYHKGELSLHDFQAVLQDLLFDDIEGNVWTIGSASGKWYRRLGDEWVLGIPSGSLTHVNVRKAGFKQAVKTKDQTKIQAKQELELDLRDPIIQQLLHQADVKKQVTYT